MRPYIKFNAKASTKLLLVNLSREDVTEGVKSLGRPVWNPYFQPRSCSLFTTLDRISAIQTLQPFIQFMGVDRYLSYKRGGLYLGGVSQRRGILPRFRLYLTKRFLTERGLKIRDLNREQSRPYYVKWWGSIHTEARRQFKPIKVNLLSWLSRPILVYFWQNITLPDGTVRGGMHSRLCGETGFNFCGVYLDWYAFWSRVGVIGVSTEHDWTPTPVQPGVQLTTLFRQFTKMNLPTPHDVGPWGMVLTRATGLPMRGLGDYPTQRLDGSAALGGIVDTSKRTIESLLNDGSITVEDWACSSRGVLENYIETLTHYFMGIHTLRSAYSHEFFKVLVAPYRHITQTWVHWVGELGENLNWVCFLTFHFKKRSLYVGLQQPGVGCIFSYSSGMFLPNYRQYWLPRKLQKLQLKYRRGLGHKDRKEYNKKKQVISWKCKRFTYSTKIFLMNYIKLWLVWARPMQLCLILHGVARGWRHLLSEVLWGGDRIEKARLAQHTIICTCIYGGFRCTSSKRAISRRLTKQMWKATKVSKAVN